MPLPCLPVVCWQVFDIPWFIEASTQSLSLSSCGLLPMCISVSKFPLLTRTEAMLDLGPTLLQYYLILT